MIKYVIAWVICGVLGACVRSFLEGALYKRNTPLWFDIVGVLFGPLSLFTSLVNTAAYLGTKLK